MVAVKVREQDGIDERRVHPETLHRGEGGGATVNEQVCRFGPYVDASLETTSAPESVSTSQKLYPNFSHGPILAQQEPPEWGHAPEIQ